MIPETPRGTDRAPRDTESDGLRRVLGDVDAAALAVGIVVGTGIFAVPGFVARDLGAPGPILFVWLLGGLIAGCGALTYAEIGSMYPRQGGGFLFVLEAFGPFAAFFKGWGSFLVGYPASSAGIATILGIYAVEAFHWNEGAVRPVAIGAAAAVWLLNLGGTRLSASLQTALTLVKIGAIGLLALGALAFGQADWSRLVVDREATWPGVGPFAFALVGVLWTYDGWENLTVVGGEIGNPRRRIVRGLLLTVGVVTALYLLLNVSYLVLLPMPELQETDSVAAAAAEAVLGPGGRTLLSLLVVLSSFGALFGIGIAGPRYYWSMATHGLFFDVFRRLDGNAAPRTGATALFLLTVFYIVTGTFEQIFSYYIAVSLIYNILTILCVFRLRAKFPHRERPFRVPLYPFLPMVFVLAALIVTGHAVAGSPARNAGGLLLLLLATPAYFVWKKRRPSRSRAEP